MKIFPNVILFLAFGRFMLGDIWSLLEVAGPESRAARHLLFFICLYCVSHGYHYLIVSFFPLILGLIFSASSHTLYFYFLSLQIICLSSIKISWIIHDIVLATSTHIDEKPSIISAAWCRIYTRGISAKMRPHTYSIKHWCGIQYVIRHNWSKL